MLFFPDTDQLSQIFAHATAPAFLLGAVAGFISILLGRLANILDRIRSLNEISDDDEKRLRLRSDLPRLKTRVRLLGVATYLALWAGICTTLLLALAFVSAFFRLRHEYGAALLFFVAVLLLGASLYRFAQEIRMGISEADHYR